MSQIKHWLAASIAAVMTLSGAVLVSSTVGTVAAEAAPVVPVGVPAGISPGAELMWLSEADLSRELDTYTAAGSTWLRLDFDWSVIEPTQGQLDWTAADRVVNAARARNLSVLGIVTYTPSWAGAGTGSSHTPPSSPTQYAAFAAEVAARYSGRVSAYEIWNEPNNALFWVPAADPVAYTNLLKAAYPAIKAADPNATVIAGALSPALDRNGWLSPLTFARGIYAAGGKDYMDALSVHPYCFPAMPSDASTSSWNTFYRVPLLRDLMVSQGDSAKTIWLTEFGAPTGTAATAVSESDQAAAITDGFRLARTWSWAGPLFVYSGRDRGTNLADREDNFGIIRRDFTEKLGMAAFRTAAGGPPIVVPGMPTNLKATALTATTARVSWGLPTSGGTPTDYVLRYSRNFGSWVTLTHTPSTATSVTLTGLRAGSSYRVQVSLRNSAGVGAAAATSFQAGAVAAEVAPMTHSRSMNKTLKKARS